MVSGIYAYCRNPSIWGKLVGVLSVGIALNSFSFCCVLVPALLSVSLIEKVWRQEPQLVEVFGDDASPMLMPRTPGQRRADALKQIFLDAASTPPGAKAPAPVANVHLDHASFQDILVEAELLPERDVDPFDDRSGLQQQPA